ncbi:hypothetical protein D9611_009967 [Ephemerocybe angulata]|uniref:Uncharacterized protein n=1 Tax=Ephemerocybe angulata TaxID=980116 RepID=A0A8H5C472_9AGAR|nr:hypothetical protein D9611_009967 [Tulosesus angulatus]
MPLAASLRLLSTHPSCTRGCRCPCTISNHNLAALTHRNCDGPPNPQPTCTSTWRKDPRLLYDENTYRKLNSGSVINNRLSPARAFDPTPPQLPSTMAVRRTSAVAGLTVIKSESFRPHVACQAHEKSNLQEHDLQRKTGHPPTTDVIGALNEKLVIFELKGEQIPCSQIDGPLTLSPDESKPNGSRNQDFRNLQKTADVRRSSPRNSNKPGSTCEDSLPRDAEVRPANHTHRRQTTTRFPHRRRELRDLRRYDHYDTGHLSPHHAFDTALPADEGQVREKLELDIWDVEATAKTTAFGVRAFEAIFEQTTKATAVPEASASRARRATKAIRRWEAPMTHDSRGDGGRHGAMGRATTTALATSAQ